MTIALREENHPGNRDFRFSDAEFDMIAALANAKYGLFLQPSKKALVYSRLAKRLRALNLPEFADYCALLESPDGAVEHQYFLTALTTNVTHFFREMHHFDFLAEQVLPQLIEKCHAGQPVRIWSAACSSGQEAYCIAATALRADPTIGKYDFRILATDIDPQMIAIAKQAEYPHDQLEAIPKAWRDLLTDGSVSGADNFGISPNIRKMVRFGELNLMDAWPMKRPFDIIFCRNAAIYFDKTTQAKLWQRFAAGMTEGGHLMIGHSERLSGPAQAVLKSVGITTYQKAAPQDAVLTHNKGEET